ncbi:bacteriocin, partial [Enterococcus faecalis]
GLYLFMGLIIVGVMGAGYYFKIYKKNEEASFEDEQDYNELEDDYESEGEDYDLEDKEDTEIIPDEDEF